MRSSKLRVSVIICAYTEQRWGDLVDSVAAVKKQTLPPYEVILVIDHSPSLYQKAISYFSSSILVVENQYLSGSSGARNFGAEQANGDILAFIDDDAFASSNWLENLISEYDNPAVMGVGGKIIPKWDNGRPGWFPSEFDWVVGCTYRGAPETKSQVRNLILCNMSIKRDIFNSIEGFRVGMGHVGGAPKGDEETELCIRAQETRPDFMFVYTPVAVVFHHVPESRTTLKYFFWRCSLEGHSKALLSRLVGSNKGLSSERTYTFRTLPSGVIDGVLDMLLRLNIYGLGRASVIIAGLLTTTWAYLWGRLSLNSRIDA